MLLAALVIAALVVGNILAWFLGVLSVLWVIQGKHPHVYAELVNERKRGGKDALSS